MGSLRFDFYIGRDRMITSAFQDALIDVERIRGVELVDEHCLRFVARHEEEKVLVRRGHHLEHIRGDVGGNVSGHVHSIVRVGVLVGAVLPHARELATGRREVHELARHPLGGTGLWSRMPSWA